MKKLICILLSVIVIASVLLCSCGGDEAKDSEADTTAAPATDAVTDGTEDAGTDTEEASDTKPAQSGEKTLEGLETVADELGDTYSDSKFENSRQYYLVKKNVFESGDKEYNWYEFYNACIAGEIDSADAAAAQYVADSLELFERYDLADEASQAKTLTEYFGEVK